MVLAILQARMSSTRLPGKVLRPILGRPMLARQIERVRRSQLVTRLVVATSDETVDDAVVAACDSAGTETFRGSRDDVLGRYLGAMRAAGPTGTIIRLTADCPLADPFLIDEAIRSHRRSGADITTVQRNWTFPKGLDVEVVESAALEAADAEARREDREHVTAHIYRHGDRYRINAVDRDPPLRFRWTVDTEVDLEFVQAVYEALYPRKPTFTTADVLAWQGEHPDRALPYDPAGGAAA